MDEQTATGIDYPTIKIGDTEYTVKFTRGLLYDLDTAGINFNPSITKGGAKIGLAPLMDTFKLAIGFPGTAKELTELAFDQRDEILDLLVAGWGKVVLPSLKLRTAALAANKQMAASQIQ